MLFAVFAVSVLEEIGVFFRNVAKLLKNSPPEVVAIVILGSAFVGLMLGWVIFRGKGRPPGDCDDCATEREKREEAERNLAACKTQGQKFNKIRAALLGKEDEIWRLYSASPPDQYFERLAKSKTKIITTMNLKGGVGKTTITANLAAYFEGKGQSVLVIDLDYQRSLSDTLLSTAGMGYVESVAEDFLGGQKDGQELLKLAKPLGSDLSNVLLVTSSYDLARFENRLMLKWLLQETDRDIRYNLGEVLLHPKIQEQFQVVLIDAPPRLSTAAVNALVASHHLIIPTVPDLMSIPPVARFLAGIERILPELNPALNSAGVVLNLTSGPRLSGRELDAKGELQKQIVNGGMNAHIYDQHIQRLDSLATAAGQDVLYLRSPRFREAIFDPLGAEVAKSIGFGVVK